MPWWTQIGEILKPISDIVGEVVTNKEERAMVETKLKEVVFGFETKIKELEVQAEKQRLEDVANARAMQTAALSQDDKFSKRFVYYFIIVWSLFSMAFIVGVTFFEIPAESVRFADTILGFILGTAIASVFQYMVGSTRGSESKNEAIKNLSKTSNGT